jgi:hypothetical protein
MCNLHFRIKEVTQATQEIAPNAVSVSAGGARARSAVRGLHVGQGRQAGLLGPVARFLTGERRWAEFSAQGAEGYPTTSEREPAVLETGRARLCAATLQRSEAPAQRPARR